MKDGLEQFGLLAGGLAGVLWVVAVSDVRWRREPRSPEVAAAVG